MMLSVMRCTGWTDKLVIVKLVVCEIRCAGSVKYDEFECVCTIDARHESFRGQFDHNNLGRLLPRQAIQHTINYVMVDELRHALW
jgi:hypothetical protein